MFSMTLDLGYGMTITIFMSLFLVLLGIKLSLRRYDPLLYWSVFTASAIVGTGISDFIDRTLGLGYATGSAFLIMTLLAILALWYIKERSISVDNIRTTAGEVYYWLAFLVANTLGTAAGDYLADGLDIGFLDSAVMISGLLAITALLKFYTNTSTVFLFWVAFVLTRPFGATFGDLLTKPATNGGLDLGTIAASALFATILSLSLVKELQLERRRRMEKV